MRTLAIRRCASAISRPSRRSCYTKRGVSYEWAREDDYPNSTAPSVEVSGYFTGGGASLGNSRQFRSGFEYDDDVILTTARHSIKTGTQLLWKHRDSNLLMDFNGGYIFAGAAQYLTNQPEEFSNVTGRPNVRTDQVRFAGFLQDDFKVRKNLSLSMGLRYLLETDPATFHNFDPRFGVAWSLGGKQSWALKSQCGCISRPVFFGPGGGDSSGRWCRTHYEPDL